jgi:hypothetical protein
MIKTLEDRLKGIKIVLDDAYSVIGRHPDTLESEVEERFRKVIDYGSEIEHWIDLIHTRSAAWQLLNNLDKSVDRDGFVTFGSFKIEYKNLRLIYTIGYITANWALADSISKMVGLIFCLPEVGSNPITPTQIVTHFIGKETKKKTAGTFYISMRNTYGWPVSVFYAIRNHFMHEGGQSDGSDFFEGPAASSAFKISNSGWQMILKQAEGYDDWPSDPRQDLRVILSICERELDDAIGLLAASACNLLHNQIGILLGEV